MYSGQTQTIGTTQTNAVAYGNGKDAPRETVQQSLDDQEKRIGELHNAISQLEDRLTLVLAPSPAGVNANGAEPTPSNLGLRVNYHSRLLSMASHRIATLLDRLEI